ncbi:hypothetical protein CsSME_00019138 [Camellia sinensis var. sinensis]
MYLTTTRPDIMHAVSLISRYMENPTQLHLLAAKRIFRYLVGTINFGILYRKEGNFGLLGFTDSDYAGDPDDRRSTSGYVFMMGSDPKQKNKIELGRRRDDRRRRQRRRRGDLRRSDELGRLAGLSAEAEGPLSLHSPSIPSSPPLSLLLSSSLPLSLSVSGDSGNDFSGEKSFSFEILST